jgi:hypothetical protein
MLKRATQAGVLIAVGLWGVGCGGSAEEAPARLSQRAAALTASSGPDLVVKAVSGPASMMSGSGFSAQVKVCNEGSLGANADVELFLSTDADITLADLSVGGNYLGYLSPGQCTTQSVPASAYVADGTWFLGAITDRQNLEVELDESNNARAGAEPLSVGYGPDFVVKSVKGPASVYPGQSFTASVTLCNQGTDSGSPNVQLLLSQDANIQLPNGPQPSPDSLLAPVYVGYLNPGQCTTTQVYANAYAPQDGAWYLGAVIEGTSYGAAELRTDNNTRASDSPTSIGYGPDFVVKSVKGPASVYPGQGFTASVTLCNQGTDYGSPMVHLVLSQDTNIQLSNGPQPEDHPLAPVYVGYLNPGQCTTTQVYANAYAPQNGPWYLGAIIEGNSYGAPELRTDNNTRASDSPTSIGYGTDFVVKSVKGPASAYPGQSFTATVTLCNEGTDSGSPMARLVLSRDTNIQLPMGSGPAEDMPLGPVYVDSLSPGQCTTTQVYANAYAPQDGAWYLGVAIEESSYGPPELRTDNNTRASASPMGIGYGTDFVVKEIKAPASLYPGQSFTAMVTLCNQGTDSGSPNAHLVLSQDTSIQSPFNQPYPEDLSLAPLYVGYLAPGQCTTTPVYANAYAPQNGAWYLGVFIEATPYAYPLELRTDNNTRASDEPVGIGYGPDFVVKSVKGPASVQPGQGFTATVTLCNQGTDSGSPYANLVLSQDTSIEAAVWPSYQGDPTLAPVQVGQLAPGQCATQQVQANAYPPQSGPWYLGVAIDASPYAYPYELRTDNNTRASDEPVGIGYGPDYVVKSVKGPVSVQPGQSFTATVTLCNQGTDSGSPYANLVLSQDTSIEAAMWPSSQGDPTLAPVQVGPLAPGQCATQQVQTSVYPPQSGPWYLGVAIDASPYSYPYELRTDNNTRASDEPVGIGYAPDYVVKSVKGPASVQPGQGFTATVTLCNQGTDSGSPYAHLVLSRDTSIQAPVWPSYQGDPLLTSVSVGQLAPGQCATQQVQASAYAPQEGAWYLGVAIESSPYSYPQELRTDNNTRASDEPMGIGYAPDYVVKSVTGPASAQPGQSFLASVTLCNEGTDSGSPSAYLVLSQDTNIQSPFNQPYPVDLPLGPVSVGTLYPGQCATQQMQVSANVPQEGPWYLGAAIESNSYSYPQELRTDNNTRASDSPMGIGYLPDFVVKSVKGPANVRQGDSFMASVTVCNEGTESGSTYAHLLLSRDTNIQLPFNQPSPEDLPLGPVDVGHLYPGQCVTKQVQASASAAQDGLWYLGAAIEGPPYGPTELRTDNNARASDSPMGVGHAPDYVVKSVKGPANARPGDPFTAAVTVCNEGTESGNTYAHLVLSQDSNIQLPFNQPFPEDLLLGPVDVGHLYPGQCVTKQVQASVSMSQNGLWYLGAAIESNPSSYPLELRTDNNARASDSPMGIGDGPDFAVKSVSGPANAAPGQSFTASVTVCNEGTESGNTYAHLVLSRDTNIQLPFNQPFPVDMLVGQVDVGHLYPGQCVTKQVQASANVPQDGLWYLGAAIEANSSSYPYELRTDNNARASDSPMGVGYKPDYAVKAVSGPSNVQPGQSFMASVTLCNEGTEPGNTYAHLVFSQDTNIQLPFNQPYLEDFPAGQIDSGYLQEGQCVTKQVQVNANVPQDGLWYLGAAIEVPPYGSDELRTDNNALASQSPMGIGFYPDFVVKSVKGPANVRQGDSFTASVTVCNEGTESGSTYAHLLLSTDSNIQLPFNQPYPGDLPLGPVDVGHLYPGQCVTKQVQASASAAQDGLWYLGAAIEGPPYGPTELRTDNNARASDSPMGIGDGPDFVVKSVKGPANVEPSQPFTAMVTLCNEGTEPGYTSAYLLLSEDTNIQLPFSQPYPEDLLLAPVDVGYLYPGQCVTKQVQASANVPQDGLWYLGAAIEANPSSYPYELRTDNNARASDSPLGVGHLPDFVVKAVSGPANVQPGQSFTATVTLCNEGTQPGSSYAHLLLSEDTNIQLPFNQPFPEDFPVAPVDTGYLYPGQCVTKQVQGNANVPRDGLWYLGATIEGPPYGQPELRTDNNMRASDSPMGVGHAPDFVVKSVKGPASVRPGDSFMATVTLCNEGTQSGSSYGALVLSADTNIQRPFNQPYLEDFPVGPVDTGHLQEGQCVTRQVQGNASVPQDGLWYLGVALDVPPSGPSELRTDNNALASDSPMGIGYLPDFVVKSVKGPANVRRSDSFTASVTVCNEGTESGSTYAHLLLSTDSNIQLPFNQPYPGDLPLGPVDVGHLYPGQCVTKQVQASASAAQDGLWYLGAAIEGPPYGPTELRTDNNARASDSPMGIGDEADFAVKSVKGPTNVQPGQSFTATVTVCNEGTESGNTYAHLVLSQDSNIQLPFNQPFPEDLPLGPVDVGYLYPGQCVTKQVQASANVPQDGLWYLGAVIEGPPYGPPELRTDNNARASDSPMGIGNGPDFVVKSVKGPTNVQPGQSFTATVTLCNEGTQPGNTYGGVVLSADKNIQLPFNQSYPEDFPMGPVDTGSLQPGQCVTKQVQGSANVPQDGLWYLGAALESPYGPGQPELRTDNNARASDEPMGVGNAPDFAVKSVKGPASVRPGDSFTATVMLCNEGTQPGNTYGVLVLSADRNIQTPFNQPYTEDMPVGPLDTGSLQPGQCVTKQVQGSANVPQGGLWYLGAVLESPYGPGQPELRTDNNTRASDEPMGVGNAPDFMVQSVKGPANVRPGDPFTATVTVCNQGTEPGMPYTHLVLSADTNIQLPFNQPYMEDMPLGPVDVGHLQAGQCVTKQVQAQGPGPQEGVWYLGAAIEVLPYGPSELRTDNNTRASDEPMGAGFKPDFMVQSVTGPASVKPGDAFTATVTVCNQGTEPGHPYGTLVLSQDTVIQSSYNQPNPEDLPLAGVDVGPLNPGQCATQQVSTNAWGPQEGLWYLGVAIDGPPSLSSELRMDNNTRASAEPLAIGYKPDFVVGEVRGPASARQGDPFMVTVKLCNQGTEPGMPYGTLVLSADTTIELPFNQPYSEDFPLTSVDVGMLPPGQCGTQQVSVNAHVPQTGPWYLGVIIDSPPSSSYELRTDNNTRASDEPVGIGSAPDFFVEQVSGPASAVMGSPLSATVTVCNQGTEPGMPSAHLLFSRDAHIQLPFNQPSPEDYLLVPVDVGPLSPGQCSTVQVSTSAYAPKDGDWFLGAAIEASPYGPGELNTRNNSKAGNVVALHD